jgi:hypothetical protein
MSRTLELTARYETERCRFANADNVTIIGSVRLANGSRELAAEYGVSDPHGSLAIKGEETGESLIPGTTYRFLGQFSNYTNRRTGQVEKQFHFRTFTQHVPADPEGMVRYLVECGKGNGIGPAKAKKLVESFGVEEVLEQCRRDPERIAMIAKIDVEQAQRLSDKLRAQQATEAAKIELDQLLTGKGFPRSLPGRLLKEWGNQAAAIIVEDPYKLMQFKGVGFKLADKLYMELGKDPASIDRQALYLWYAMASDSNGHSWFPAEAAVRELRRSVGPGADYRAAIIRGRDYGQIDESHYGAIASIRTDGVDGPLRSDGDTLWLAEGKVAAQEQRLAELITRAITEGSDQVLTLWQDSEIFEQMPASVARCHRCGRALTADTVHVIDGKPYGPTCVGKVAG